MRTVAAFFILALASFGLAPSSPELHARYGLSDWERFTVRPGITATVQYGADHLACQVLIQPYQTLVHDHLSGNPHFPPQYMPAKDVDEIVEEFAPDAMRGKEIGGGGFQASCGIGEFQDYENVQIIKTISACMLPKPNQLGAEVLFKRDTCPEEKNPFGAGKTK
jgi:hypothetical protein